MASTTHSQPTYPEYTELRAAADRASGGFVDPIFLHRGLPALLARRGSDWVSTVLGRQVESPRYMHGSDLELLRIADERDIDPPAPTWLIEVRAAEESRRAAAAAERAAREAAAAERLERCRAEWAALRTALPVPTQIYHNYTSARHLDGYVQGLDHILVEADLHVGRIHRPKGEPLCWTPSRAKNLRHFGDPYDGRLPECKACLRWACKLTGLDAPTLLDRNHTFHA